jgi:hypothetical protein
MQYGIISAITGFLSFEAFEGGLYSSPTKVES